MSGVLPYLVSLTDDAETGEQLLLAIANMEKLRILDFTVSYGGLYSWMPGAGSQPASDVLGRGLRRLRALHGDLFPAPRMHRLWGAVTAAKAQAGAVPLTRFGTSVARNGFAPPARFLEASGAPLETLQLDLRVNSSRREDNTVAAFHASRLSLAACPRLRSLTVHLDAPWRGSVDNLPVCAALLCTAPPTSALAHIAIIVENLRAFSAAVHGVPEALGALDARMAALPRLRRVDWKLVSRMSRAGPEDDITDPLVDGLRQCLPLLALREGVEVTWTMRNRR
ncbi:hypothetical protein PsYK624_122760 [Phanerochaete sordida]|uniref:Uncharacterized protein n=1 Tax=Phanerochaete sordida TaxID=48140 RepID=A0A9P3GJI0_9APHY|nr:hypothetical protein PsYK624_122760 [Phanerochaete sordida]